MRTNEGVRSTYDAEQEGQHEESEELNRLAADGVDESGRHPVSHKSPGNKHQVANGRLVEDLVHV